MVFESGLFNPILVIFMFKYFSKKAIIPFFLVAMGNPIMHIHHFIHSFIGWTFRFIPLPGRYEWCSSKLACSSISVTY